MCVTNQHETDKTEFNFISTTSILNFNTQAELEILKGGGSTIISPATKRYVFRYMQLINSRGDKGGERGSVEGSKPPPVGEGLWASPRKFSNYHNRRHFLQSIGSLFLEEDSLFKMEPKNSRFTVTRTQKYILHIYEPLLVCLNKWKCHCIVCTSN